MTNRSVRTTLCIGCVLCIVAAVGAVATTFLPKASPTQSPAQPMISAVVPQESEPAAQAKVGESQFRLVWDKSLQRPLHDDQQPKEDRKRPEKKERPSPPPLRFKAKLLATLVDPEPSFARAWLMVGNARELVGLGQVLEEQPGHPKVVEIAQRKVVLEISGRHVTIEMDARNPIFGEASSKSGRETTNRAGGADEG